MPTTSKTFRGRSLETVLPQISTELGEDAIVLRCREGLRGGIFGFFRRPCVEIEATVRPVRGEDVAHDEAEATRRLDAALTLPPDAPALEVRSDRATTEGLSSPAVQLLVEQAAPFADRLRAAQHGSTLVSDGDAASHLATAGLTDPQLYGPQPSRVSLPVMPRLDAPAADVAPTSTVAIPAPVPADPPAPELPTAARTAESRLVFCGMDSALAADVVGEAVVHGLPFGSPRSVKKLVRAVLAQRLATLGHRGPGAMTVAVTGPAGAGTSTVVGHLAAAYARAGAVPVVVIALRSPDGGDALRRRLSDLDVQVHAAADGAQARTIAAEADGAMVFVDLPAVTLGDGVGLALELEALAADELHLALPATTSAASADELTALLDPVGLTHVALTRTDETRRPGAGLGFCMASRRPLSYLSAREGIAPADATAVAQLLLP